MESKNQENPDDFIGLIFTYFKEYGTQSEIPLKDSENFVNSSFDNNDAHSAEDLAEFELNQMIDHHADDIGHISDGVVVLHQVMLVAFYKVLIKMKCLVYLVTHLKSKRWLGNALITLKTYNIQMSRDRSICLDFLSCIKNL